MDAFVFQGGLDGFQKGLDSFGLSVEFGFNWVWCLNSLFGFRFFGIGPVTAQR